MLFAGYDIAEVSEETIFAQVLVLDRLYSTRLNDNKNDDKRLRSVTVKKMATHIYNNRKTLSRIIENVRRINGDDKKFAEAYTAIELLLKEAFENNGNEEVKTASLPYSFSTKYCSFFALKCSLYMIAP